MYEHPEAHLAGKVTRILPRADGSEVKIVATDMSNPGGKRSVDVTVFRRATPEQPWEYCSDRPHPDWRTMSVDEYVKRGRSPMLQAVTHGEILVTASLVGKPMSAFSNTAPA